MKLLAKLTALAPLGSHTGSAAEGRRLQRCDINSPCDIFWQDARGVHRAIRGRVVDISGSGVRVECYEPIECNSVVELQAARYAGVASVRHCTAKRLKYILGLEFQGSR